MPGRDAEEETLSVEPLLPSTARRLGHTLAELQREARLPSLVAAVVREGEVVWDLGLGAVDDAPPTRDTQYRIGSITKTFTAVLVLQLRDKGRLDLGDRLEAHVPGTPFGDRTIRQLLSHTAGLRQEPETEFWEAVPGPSREELLDGLHPGQLTLPAGRWLRYSNLGYALLGEVVARRHGSTWAEALQRRLLDPLDLTRTTYLPHAPYAPGLLVHPWRETVTDEPTPDTGAMAPAGQLWSTAIDLARWAAFLCDPDPNVLDRDSLEEMREVAVMDDHAGWSAAAGLGFQLRRRSERVLVGHGGSMPGFVAGLMTHPANGLGAVALANATFAANLRDTANDLIETVLDAEPARGPAWRPEPADGTPPEVAELLGSWWWRGQELVVFARGGALHLRDAEEAPGSASRFAADGPDTWLGVEGVDRGEHLRVLRAPDGAITALDLDTAILRRTPDASEPRG